MLSGTANHALGTILGNAQREPGLVMATPSLQPWKLLSSTPPCVDDPWVGGGVLACWRATVACPWFTNVQRGSMKNPLFFNDREPWIARRVASFSDIQRKCSLVQRKSGLYI